MRAKGGGGLEGREEWVSGIVVRRNEASVKGR